MKLAPISRPYSVDYISSYEQESLDELLSLTDDNVISRDRLSWWLLKHEEFVGKVFAYNQSLYNYQLPDGTIARLKDQPFEMDLGEHLTMTYRNIERFVDTFNKEEELREELLYVSSLTGDEINKWAGDHYDAFIEDYYNLLLDQGDDYSLGDDLIMCLIYLPNENRSLRIAARDMEYSMKYALLCQELVHEKNVLELNAEF